MDTASAAWLSKLRADGPVREAAVTQLHGLLLRVAWGEAARRRGRLPDRVVVELDELCSQAASDAIMAILRKLESFEGASRFTTWACKFVIFELSSALRRRSWAGREVETDETVWNRLADLAPSPLAAVQHSEAIAALRRAVNEDLTDRQRLVFLSAAVEEVPIDVLADRLTTSRGAIYKTLHDARRKIRMVLSAKGHLDPVAG